MIWIGKNPTNSRTQRGFTIVELLIVIVIIAILAAITVVAYNNIQSRGQFSRAQSDFNSIMKALALYKVDNNAYPITIGQSGCTNEWCGWDQATGDNFIVGLAPKYMSTIPQMPSSQPSANTYLYRSNGTDYQLIRYNSTGLTQVEMDSPLHITDSGYNGIAWGYKTNSAWW